jgi:hypothetical protein
MLLVFAANNGTPQQPQNQQPSRLKDCAKAYYGFNTASGAAQDATRIALIPAAPIIPKAAVGLPQALGSGPLTNLLSYFSLGSGTAASGANIFRVAGRIGAPIAIASAVIDATAIGICASDYQGWWLAHLYVFCKGGDGNGRRSQLLFARASTLALCSTIPSAATAATICISSLAVVIIDKPGWPAHSGAICF